jgi:hypothetical protein
MFEEVAGSEQRAGKNDLLPAARYPLLANP